MTRTRLFGNGIAFAVPKKDYEGRPLAKSETSQLRDSDRNVFTKNPTKSVS